MTTVIGDAFVRVRADGSDFTRDLDASLRRFQTNLDNTQGRIRALGVNLNRVALYTGFAVLAQQATALAAALTPVVGIIAAIPGAVAQAGAGIGTLFVGLSGIGDAFKETQKATQAAAVGAATDTTSMQRAIEAASRGIVSAQRDVTRAMRDVEDANYGVEQAQRSLLGAQNDVLDSELQLTQAREAATRALADYQDQIDSAVLSQERAQINLEEAQKRLSNLGNTDVNDNFFDVYIAGSEEAKKKLDELASKQTTNSLEFRKASLDVAEAQFRLQQAIENTTDVQKDANKAIAAGVEGDAKVVTAREQLTDATQRVAEASHSLELAQRAVGDANQGVADAQEQVVLANQQLEDSINSLTKAQNGGSAAASRAAVALAALSPNARAFVQTVIDLRDEWDKLKNTVQDALFADLDDEVTRLANASLPTLTTGLKGIAAEFNNIAKKASQTASAPFFQDRAATVFRGTADSLKIVGDSIGPLIDGFTNLAAVAQPTLLRLNQSVGDFLTRFGDFAASEEGTKRFTEILVTAEDVLRSMVTVAGNLGDVLKNIFTAAYNAEFLDSLEKITAQLAEVTGSKEGQEQLQIFFQNMARLSEKVGEVLPQVLELVVNLTESFNKLPGPVQEATLSFFAWSIALGPLTFALSKVTGSVTSLIGIFQLLTRGPLRLVQGFAKAKKEAEAIAKATRATEEAAEVARAASAAKAEKAAEAAAQKTQALMEKARLADEKATQKALDKIEKTRLVNEKAFKGLESNLDSVSKQSDKYLGVLDDLDKKQRGYADNLDDLGKRMDGVRKAQLQLALAPDSLEGKEKAAKALNDEMSKLQSEFDGVSKKLSNVDTEADKTFKKLDELSDKKLKLKDELSDVGDKLNSKDPNVNSITKATDDALAKLQELSNKQIDLKVNVDQKDLNTGKIGESSGSSLGTSFLKGFGGGVGSTALGGIIAAGLGNPIGLAIAAAAAGVAAQGSALYFGIKYREEIGKFLTKTLPNYIKDNFPKAFDAAVQGAAKIAEQVGISIGSQASFLYNKGRELIQGFVDGSESFVTDTLIPFVAALPGRVVAAIGDLSHILYEQGKQLLAGLLDGAQFVWDNIIYPYITGRPDVAVRGIGNLARILYNKGREFFQGLFDGIRSFYDDTVKPFLDGLPERFRNALPDPLRTLYDRGKDLIKGLANGIIDAVKDLNGAVGSVVKAFLKGLDEGWDMHSPSKETFARGQYLMQGLINGIEAERSALQSTMDGVSAQVLDGLGFSTSQQLGLSSLSGLAGTAAAGPTVVKQYNLTLAADYKTTETPEENFRRMELLSLPYDLGAA